MPVRVQIEDFDVSAEIAQLRADNPKVGAVASFVGIVRDLNEGDAVASLRIPGIVVGMLHSDQRRACVRMTATATRSLSGTHRAAMSTCATSTTD